MTAKSAVADANTINPHFLEALSPRLAAVPALTGGMMGQVREAGAAKFNASIGSSLRNRTFWTLDGIEQWFPPEGLPYGSIYADTAVATWNRFIARFCDNPSGDPIPGPQNGVATHGIGEGLDMLAGAYLEPGDAVILPDQTWPNIGNLFMRWHGAKAYAFPFYSDGGGYNLTAMADALKQARADGHHKAMVYLNSPTNPNGYVFRPQDLSGLREVLREAAKDLTIIALCDEAYMSLSYIPDGHRGPVAEHLYGLGPRVFVYSLTGASKMFQMFGARAGFLSLWHQPAALWPHVQDKFLWMARTKRSFANNTILTLLTRALEDPARWDETLAERHEVLKSRYEAVWAAANRYAAEGGWTVYPGGGGYFLLLDVGAGNAELARQRALEQGVGLITQGDRNIRIAISCLEAEDADELFRRLARR